MAESVKVIDPDVGAGYDYDSLFDWEAAQQADIDTPGTIAVAKCRCTGGTADTTAVTIDGWTTSAADYIKIWTDPAESYRHNGTYQTGNKYRIITSNLTPITNNEQYTRFIGIQLSLSGSGNPDALYSNSTDAYAIACIATKTGADTGISGFVNVNCINCIAYNFPAGGFLGHTLSTICYSCTSCNNNYGYSENTGTLTAKNCIAYNNSASGFNIATKTYSASSDTSAGSSDGNRSSQTFSFVGASDFHLQANDTGALGFGLNLYNDATYPFQTDIDGQDRGGAAAAWDIGADEYVAAAADSIVPILLNRYRARRQ